MLLWAPCQAPPQAPALLPTLVVGEVPRCAARPPRLHYVPLAPPGCVYRVVLKQCGSL